MKGCPSFIYRVLFWTVICLLGGVIMNVGIAIVCTLVAQQWPELCIRSGFTPEDHTSIKQEFGFHIGAFSRVGKMKSFGYEELNLNAEAIYIYTDWNEGVVDVSYEYPKMTEVHAGWPLKVLHGRITILQDYAEWDLHWVNWSGQAKAEWGHFVIPKSPLWLGMVGNSLFYAVLLFLIYLLPRLFFRFRVFLRVRRGKCPCCTYPIGISDRCSECGAFLRPKSGQCNSLPRVQVGDR